MTDNIELRKQLNALITQWMRREAKAIALGSRFEGKDKEGFIAVAAAIKRVREDLVAILEPDGATRTPTRIRKTTN